MIFQINCMIDLINISIQSDFNFVGDIYVSMIKSRNNHILLTIALLLGWVIKKEVSTIIQVMNITSSMGGMVTHWLMSQRNKPLNTISTKKTALCRCYKRSIKALQNYTKRLIGQTSRIAYIVIHCGRPPSKAKALMMYGSITVTIWGLHKR